jgi:hypothetical protein
MSQAQLQQPSGIMLASTDSQSGCAAGPSRTFLQWASCSVLWTTHAPSLPILVPHRRAMLACFARASARQPCHRSQREQARAPTCRHASGVSQRVTAECLWRLGVRSARRASSICTELEAAFVQMRVLWKRLGPYTYKCRATGRASGPAAAAAAAAPSAERTRSVCADVLPLLQCLLQVRRDLDADPEHVIARVAPCCSQAASA